ncbi:MAG: hypothetical protein ISQ97_04455 [Flavobacteriales bacterium]|nr:hypothetical protein [Flavobacteriales bacterium]
MAHRRIWSTFMVVAASGLSAWWVMDRKVEQRQLLNPAALASDRFTHWEYPARLPLGMAVKAGDSLPAFLFASGMDSASFIWFVSSEPVSVSPRYTEQRWGGGWLIGEDLAQWEENPGEMAAHWAPRSPGINTMKRLPNGELKSRHWMPNEDKGRMSTSWVASQVTPLAPLSPFWTQWFANIADNSKGTWQQARVGAAPAVASRMGYDSLVQRTDGSWIMAEGANGSWMVGIEMADSARSVGANAQWRDGVQLFSSAGDSLDWEDIGFPNGQVQERSKIEVDADFGRWEQGRKQWGIHAEGDRIVWRSDANSTASTPTADARIMAVTGPRSREQNAGRLGTVRNHRTDQEMNVMWEPPVVVARASDGSAVWSLEVDAMEAPTIWEVDLFRNRKYQAVVATGQKVHLVDVLGRAVKGFPKRWSRGFSAVAVFDYDRNRQYRFLMAAPNGELFNFRREGERTPGWNFTARPGRYITSLAHIRVANKDYIFAGQDDQSVRFLKRSGEDRFDSPLQFPSGKPVVFRLGASLASSTVLFLDSTGLLQERTIGENEPTGMNGLTRGQSVSLEDRTGDGIPEVVVRIEGGEEIWDARNRRIDVD